MKHPATRNTLYVEQAELLSQDEYAEGQYHMRLQAPETAAHAKPGHFIHMQCDPSLYMRPKIQFLLTIERSGERIGLMREGNCAEEASKAASANVSSLIDFAKYLSAAASTP